MKKILKYVMVSLSATLILFSCTKDFEDINTNPNEADRVTNPGLLLPDIIWEFADENTDKMKTGGSVADQVYNLFNGSFNDWTRSDANHYGWGFYEKLKDIDYMIEISDEQGLANYKAVGMIIRAWMFQFITDNFGPIPYTEAGAAKDDINFPKYDAQETVYAGILAELKEANALLGTSSEALNGDILYDGNVENWKKFANGLRLRILLRQSDRIDPSAEMQEMISDPLTYPLFTSHEDQAALQYLPTMANAHPAYTGNVSTWSSSSSTRISHNMASILNGMNDPRIAVYALPTAATMDTPNPEYHGVPNGLQDPSEWNGGVHNHSLLGMLWAPKQYDPVLVSMDAPQSIFMPYSEVQFILAEARERGFINVGDAATYYMNGVKDQFEYYSSRIPGNWTLPTAAQLIPSPGYYAQEAVAYTGTQQEKLNKIYTQKWISLFTVGFEAWSGWRRVGVPAIEPGPATSGFIPTRYVYPADEMRLNEDNYKEAVSMLDGPDEISTRVWWDVN